uniref:HRAS-like suppressor 3 n=1 Tax=Podarcis muralis TaxID=64176 RepID=A0A670JQI2_PODMU|nr:HRAS-like suppressor 3 [Podarcis muralis]
MAESPKPGDQIEIYRLGYQHWAIYVGDGYVVHLTAADEGVESFLCSCPTPYTKMGVVKKEKLSEVAGKNKWKVNNKKDRKYKARPVSEIISTANGYVGGKIMYDVVVHNCEHFAAILRYGQRDSRQVEVGFWVTFAATVAVAMGASLVAAAIIGKHH